MRIIRKKVCRLQKGMVINMKKLLVWLSVGVLALGVAGCGNTEDGSGSSDNNVPESSASPEPTQAPEPTDAPDEGGQGGDVSDSGWSAEMENMRAAVADLLGENYFPNVAMPAEYLENIIGISPDMYDDFFGEMPLISTNVDMLIVIKPAEGQADAVEEALNSYRDNNVQNSVQYPMNIGKVQGSRVGRAGDYVVFVQLGGDIMEYAEQGDAAVIAYFQQVNDEVIELIGGLSQ